MKNIAKILLSLLFLASMAMSCARGPHQESWHPGAPRKDHQSKK